MKKSIAAGALIAMASCLFLKAQAPLGGLLFGFALCMICLFELDLFTGKISFFGAKRLPYLQILAGNLLGALLVCLLLRQSTDIAVLAMPVVEKKAALSWTAALINGGFCGVLMYLAVASWAKGLKAGCFLCVSVFIFCGFEHSIADFAYMAYAWSWSINLLFILAGNAIGAITARLLIEERPVFSLSLLRLNRPHAEAASEAVSEEV